MSDNTIELDLGTTAQKTTDGEKLPVVLLARDQGKYDMAILENVFDFDYCFKRCISI